MQIKCQHPPKRDSPFLIWGLTTLIVLGAISLALGKDMKNYKKPSKEILKKTLSPLQYKVTCEEGTEPAFQNEYWNNKKEGIYVDRISGEPLFSSLDKFDSGTGWPSFTKPLDPKNIVQKTDKKLLMKR